MKALCYRTVLALGISGIMLCLAVAGSFAAGTTTPASPKITATRTVGNTLLVAASVPKGWQAVVLESRALPNSGAWVPRAVARSGLTSGRISFAVPAFLKSQTLRVRGELKEALPQAFYKGVHSFAGQSTVSWRPDQGRGEVFTLSASGSLPAMAAAPAAATSTRTVVESDIWKLDGDTLYYFNQLRGLQVIDVSNPDAAVVRGTLPLPAVGEQMYLLDSQHVVLLAQNSCGGDWQSQVLVVDVSGSAPRTVAAVPVEGWLQESRLVGTALYIASQDYRQTGSGDSADWQYGTVVSAFDLSSPAAPVARPTLWYPGYESAILATDHWLFVTTVDYSSDAQQNLVRVVDISSPDGTLQDIAGIPTAGQVPDKYSMNLSGDVFSAVSQSYQYGTGVGGTILNPVGLS
ncbi:MAG TPA: beta-propeller domain-containing protein, partial [Candidatus Acidoferrum sp.]|nr:beta-propeller domain-containing protein [Candidatus Acidoferrum sp.]